MYSCQTILVYLQLAYNNHARINVIRKNPKREMQHFGHFDICPLDLICRLQGVHKSRYTFVKGRISVICGLILLSLGLF
jgi:hypothetical protein